MHTALAKIPELIRSDTLYSPYSDCGIFGFTFQGQQDYIKAMNAVGTLVPGVLSQDIEDYELERAKNTIFNEILNIQGCSETIQQYGP